MLTHSYNITIVIYEFFMLAIVLLNVAATILSTTNTTCNRIPKMVRNVIKVHRNRTLLKWLIVVDIIRSFFVLHWLIRLQGAKFKLNLG